MSKKNMVLAIDASRNRSGGAVAHLIGILNNFNPHEFGFSEVHVFTYKELSLRLPCHDWLHVHSPRVLNGNIISQLLWQFFILPFELKAINFSILLNTDAGTVCKVKPCVTMSRDMLSYEQGEMRRYGISFAALRLLLLKYIQNSSLRRSNGVIFLTKYASEVIQKSCGKISDFKIIPHGLNEDFKVNSRFISYTPNDKIKILYISNFDLYKHQKSVVEGMRILIADGYNIELTLVGGGSGKYYKSLVDSINNDKKSKTMVKIMDFIPHSEISDILKSTDIFLFASSCENLPNTLIEAMASHLPIACSNRGPMPEVLQDGGLYFDPENPVSISQAVARLIDSPAYAQELSNRAFELSMKYSWKTCSSASMSYLKKLTMEHK